MTVYLLRHAHAGEREEWDGPDPVRPLDENGWKQADQLADIMADKDVQRILSSPYVRCVQTVEPLARRIGHPVEEHDALAEGSDPGDAVALVRSLAGTTAILCTHGDIVPSLLEGLRELDGLHLPEDYPYDKGSTWVLERDASGRFVRAQHLPPPA